MLSGIGWPACRCAGWAVLGEGGLTSSHHHIPLPHPYPYHPSTPTHARWNVAMSPTAHSRSPPPPAQALTGLANALCLYICRVAAAQSPTQVIPAHSTTHSLTHLSTTATTTAYTHQGRSYNSIPAIPMCPHHPLYLFMRCSDFFFLAPAPSSRVPPHSPSSFLILFHLIL